MGTITYHKPVGISAVESIKAEALGAQWCAEHFVAATATREAVFVVGKFHEPESKVYVPDADGTVRALLVFKLSLAPKSHYNFGYKDMDESMGPCGCEAPLSILAHCSQLRVPLGEPDTDPCHYDPLRSAVAYRDRCQRLAATKALKRSLKPGDKVTLAQPGNWGGSTLQSFTIERGRVRGRKAKVSTLFRADNGLLCSVPARYLDGATVARRTGGPIAL